MGIFNFLETPEGRSKAGQAVQDVSNRGIAGVLGAPVDLAALALKPLGYADEAPVGGSEWIGNLLEQVGMVSAQRYPVAEFLVGAALPGGLVKIPKALSAIKMPQGIFGKWLGAINSEVSELQNASRSAKMKNPSAKPQRPFHDDYPQATGSPPGSRISVDVEGRPLGAARIAGRRMVGGADEAIDSFGQFEVGRGLGINTERTSGAAIRGDAGRYVRGVDADGNVVRRIFIDANLSPDTVRKVYAHELGHAIDDLTMSVIGTGGSRIPTTGIKKELARVYSDLNSHFYVPKGKIGATPETDGYRASEMDAELMAEAIRAYMIDPNYIKTVAPKTAARIREFVNSNPNVNQVIQFNGVDGLGLTGGLGFSSLSLSDERMR